MGNKPKDYEKKESKKINEYRISLYGKISEKTEEINDIAEEGKDILIATDEIDKAEGFYKINGNDEELAKEKAKSYVEGQNALYIEAIKKGYDVTDKELWTRYSGVEGNSFNRRKQGSSARHY